jgi:hypothetical protein
MERSETTAMLTMLETTTDRLAPSTSHAAPHERSHLWHTTAP